MGCMQSKTTNRFLNDAEKADFLDDKKTTVICKALAQDMIQHYDLAGDGKLSFEEAKPMIIDFMAGMNDKIPEKFPACMILDKDFLSEVYEAADKDKTGQLN